MADDVRKTTITSGQQPTHQCKTCKAPWVRWSSGNWSLCSNKCGPCCDNVPIGDQIERLRTEVDDMYYCQRCKTIVDQTDDYGAFVAGKCKCDKSPSPWVPLSSEIRQSTISRLSEPDDEMIEKGMQAMSEVPLVAGSPDLYEMFRAALSAAAKVMEG